MTATVLLRTGTAAVTRLVALPLALGGLLIAVGGNLHPRETGATLRETLAEMLGSPAWNLSHLLILAGLVVSVAGFVLARRAHAFGRTVDRWLTVAAVCWGLASIELVPHLLAVRDLDALQHHHDTPILETHLWLAVVATPLIGLSTIALAIAVARSARTVSSWVLAAIATVGGVAYAAASPLIRFAGNPELSVLFAGQALIAVWVLGTAVRLAVRPTVPSANPAGTAFAT